MKQNQISSPLTDLKSIRDIQRKLPGDIGIPTIHRWRLAGLLCADGVRRTLPMVKIGGKYYVHETDFWSWLEQVNGKSDPAYSCPSSQMTPEELDRRLDAEGI